MYLTFFSIIFLYYRTLFKKANKLLNKVTDEESILYKNCRAWFRNYDLFKKKNIREIAPYETLNNYNRCDIYVNEKNFVVVGKWKTWIGERDLVPTIFHYEELNPGRRRFVEIKNVFLNGKDLEIEFIDILYEHVMTLVIKKPENSLVEIILRQFQKFRSISVRDS